MLARYDDAALRPALQEVSSFALVEHDAKIVSEFSFSFQLKVSPCSLLQPSCSICTSVSRRAQNDSKTFCHQIKCFFKKKMLALTVANSKSMLKELRKNNFKKFETDITKLFSSNFDAL